MLSIDPKQLNVVKSHSLSCFSFSPLHDSKLLLLLFNINNDGILARCPIKVARSSYGDVYFHIFIVASCEDEAKRFSVNVITFSIMSLWAFSILKSNL